MGSIFKTPLELLWVSNGQAEAIVDACLELARRRGITGPLVDFLHDKRTTSGLGCYGFDVTEPPLDDPSQRAILADLVAAFATVPLTGEPADLVDVPWSRVDAWHRFSWVSSLERLHDGIRCSLHDSIPRLRVPLDDSSRTAVDAQGLLDRIVELQAARTSGGTGAHVGEEIELRRRVLAMLTSLPIELQPRSFLEAFRTELAEVSRGYAK